MEQPNFSYINSLSGGDKAFEAKIMDIIKNEYPQERDIYLKNIAAKNFKEAAENVHKLKHKISILGLEKSYEVASQFENNLKENKDILKEDFSEILSSITRFLKKL
jgi:HPt (histidine-containing phosphotransfer) domain-containing protein